MNLEVKRRAKRREKSLSEEREKKSLWYGKK